MNVEIDIFNNKEILIFLIGKAKRMKDWHLAFNVSSNEYYWTSGGTYVPRYFCFDFDTKQFGWHASDQSPTGMAEPVTTLSEAADIVEFVQLNQEMFAEPENFSFIVASKTHEDYYKLQKDEPNNYDYDYVEPPLKKIIPKKTPEHLFVDYTHDFISSGNPLKINMNDPYIQECLAEFKKHINNDMGIPAALQPVDSLSSHETFYKEQLDSLEAMATEKKKSDLMKKITELVKKIDAAEAKNKTFLLSDYHFGKLVKHPQSSVIATTV